MLGERKLVNGVVLFGRLISLYRISYTCKGSKMDGALGSDFLDACNIYLDF